MPNTISHYSKHAEHYRELYNAVSASQVHQNWFDELSTMSVGHALDVGAGSGRDARWLAGQGWRVTAVEPADELRRQASQQKHSNITWENASLPTLSELSPEPEFYSLILLSAVWMHLTSSEREQAMHTLCRRLSRNGLFVITLRFGPSDPERPMYPVSVEELNHLAAKSQMTVKNTPARADDQLNRPNVHWETVLLQHMECK